MKGWETLDAIERQPDKVSGAWVFREEFPLLHYLKIYVMVQQ
jgi:hypothetical protein